MRVTKSDISLELECAVDELSPAQLAAYEKVANEHNAVKNSLKRALTNNEGKELFNGQVFQAYSFKGKVLQELKEATLPKKPPKEASADGSTSRSGRKRPSNYVYLESSSDDEEDLPLAKRLAAVQSKKSDTKTTTTTTPGRKSLNSTKSGKNSPLPLPKSGKSSKSPKAEAIAASSTQSGFRPSEITAVGGLVIGSDKDGKEAKDPAKDNKLQGKTFPSLVVLAKPWLKVKDMSTTRTKLDSKVKLVLMLTPNKFTEWLLQEGLLKAEQRCNAHRGNELKLGVYSDASKFPYTGGYVWISECCPTRFVSVFHGSIFEAAPHPPSCMLKLIYHWSCQTSIQNVVQWVKVDNVYIKGVYTWLRAVCTLAVHQKIKKMGGPDKYVEVGVISLGTTSQDGAQRQVKVEVLGIYDYTEKIIRLRAVDPVSDADRNYKKRFQTILEPLQRWVHKDSIIAIDLTVDKSTVHQMGFKNIVQASATDTTAKHTNTNVMDYLRRIVPRMFQNTLSLLSRQMIQQFLDELVWREQFGTYALQAFNQITAHIAEQTRIITNETLTQRLYQVATNPFKDWSILPANARETPANATPKRLKNLINEADYAPAKTSSKPDKKLKTEIDKKRAAPAREVTPMKNSKLRSKREPEPAPVPSKKQGKATATPTNTKHASKSTSKQAVDTKSAKKQPVVIKVQPKKEEDDNKGLEELYYGVRDGLDDYFENYPSNCDTPAQLQCPICKDEFSTTNTSLQKHLFSHINIQTDENQTQKSEQCQSCLLKFSSTSELEKHQLVHNVVTRGKESGKVQYNCLICHQSQGSLVQLTLHLTKNHNVLELPYNCQACGYRTSAHRDIIRHFYEDHHQHNFLQCPFCLDIYHFSHKGNMQPDHIELFLLHLNQHVVKIKQKIENKCGKCILSYIDQGALKFHRFHHHVSWVKNNNHIRPLLENSQVIPYPKVRSHHREQLQYSVLEKLGDFFAFIEGSICAECNCEIINEEHYPSLLKCNKCHFKTCCERAMFSHTANCNGETESRYDKEISLENEMHCICGFSTAIGNKMAAHLGSCGQKSAYPTLESALENTVKRNMLDMLGLVRRDGEASTENPETQDAEKTANEDMHAATTAPTATQDSLPFNVMDTDQDQDDNNQSFTQLVNSSISSGEVAPFQTQLDFVAPQLPLGSGEIDMPLIGDLADPNSAVAPAQYLGEVHTPMFDAIADAEQQHYHQMIHEQSNGQQ